MAFGRSTQPQRPWQASIIVSKELPSTVLKAWLPQSKGNPHGHYGHRSRERTKRPLILASDFAESFDRRRQLPYSFRSILQNLDRIASTKYLLSKSDQGALSSQYPARSAEVFLEILSWLRRDITSHRPGPASWDHQCRQDAVEVLTFQIESQLSVIKKCLQHACNMKHRDGLSLAVTYHRNEHTSFEDLSRYLEHVWEAVLNEVQNFAKVSGWEAHSPDQDPDTVSAVSFKEVVMRNELYRDKSALENDILETL